MTNRAWFQAQVNEIVPASGHVMLPAVSDVPPPIAAEIARLLTAHGWTVRKLRAQGFSAEPAAKLLGKQAGTYSIETADAALRLVGRRLWHGKA